MRTVNTEKIDKAREEILIAALGVFRKYGVAKSSMEDIASAAGKGKSTLYYYFKTKEEVFRAVCELERINAINAIKKTLNNYKTAEEKLRTFFKMRDSIVREKLKLYPVIFSETNRLNFLENIQSENNSAAIEMLKEIFIEGVNNGEFKKIKKEDCETLAVITISILRGIGINLFLKGKLANCDRKELLLDIFIRGLK
jgi:AcrR family transcriptional regulator